MGGRKKQAFETRKDKFEILKRPFTFLLLSVSLEGSMKNDFFFVSGQRRSVVQKSRQLKTRKFKTWTGRLSQKQERETYLPQLLASSSPKSECAHFW